MSRELNEQIIKEQKQDIQVDGQEQVILQSDVEVASALGNNKKIIIGLVAALVIVVAVMIAAVQSGGGIFSVPDTSGVQTDGEVLGTWAITQVIEGTNILEDQDLYDAYGGDVIYNLNEGGRLVISMIGQEFEGEWVQNGDVVEISYNDGVTNLEYTGDTLIIAGEGMEYILERQ